MTNADTNPYRAPSAPEVSVEHVGTARPRLFRNCAALQCLIISGGAVAAFVDIESIMFSGAVGTLVGIATAVFAKRGRNILGFLFGLSGPLLSAFCFALINGMGWGPNSAQDPISMIVLIYAVLALPLGVFTIFRSSNVSSRTVDGTVSS